jgi:cyclopropane-fatty-acyl-phospholipid synthase
LAKKQHIAAKLLLQPGQRILDIGCGWGGLAISLAQWANVQVTGITLSQEQLKVARARVQALGLADRVSFELCDYRQIAGTFDRIVSVGMFEHVGLGNYFTYFDDIRKLLADDGVALLHSIGRFDGPGITNAWTRKYIFPGGYIPALSEVMPSVEKAGVMVTDIEILRLHYALTLRAWRQRFTARRDEAKQLYDERFCRMWEFYLASAEASFRYNNLMVFQMQLAKSIDAVPLTRDYLSTWEDRPQQQAGVRRLHGDRFSH